MIPTVPGVPNASRTSAPGSTPPTTSMARVDCPDGDVQGLVVQILVPHPVTDVVSVLLTASRSRSFPVPLKSLDCLANTAHVAGMGAEHATSAVTVTVRVVLGATVKLRSR